MSAGDSGDEEDEPDDADDMMVMMHDDDDQDDMIATKNLAFIKSNIALLPFPALFTMAPKEFYLDGFRWIGKGEN